MGEITKWYEGQSVYELVNSIKVELCSVRDSFVSTGYWLKQIRDRKLYLETGHKDIWEFAQNQFGLSRSSASRFMAINDKFSVDGNSPLLVEEYKDFSQSQLSEMLTLTDEQIDTVTPETTVKEIRQMKPKREKPVEVEEEPEEGQLTIEDCATSHKTDAHYAKGLYEHFIYDDEKELAKSGDNTALARSLKAKHGNYQEGRQGPTHSIDCSSRGIWFNFDRDNVYTFGRIAKMLIDYTASLDVPNVVDILDNDSIDNLDLSVRAYNALKRAGVDSIDKLKDMSDAELRDTRHSSPKIVEEIKSKIHSHDAESEEQDAIHTNDPEYFNAEDVEDELHSFERILNDCRETNMTAPIRRKTAMEVAAFNLLLDSKSEPFGVKSQINTAIRYFNLGDYQSAEFYLYNARKDLVEQFGVEDASPKYDRVFAPVDQPELPKLKNNTQREEFINAYETWPLWIDIELLGKKFYKYQIDDEQSIVAEVNLRHMWGTGKYAKEAEWRLSKWYLVSDEAPDMYSIRPDHPTFVEYEVNKSVVIDFLKNYQKG